jgi:lysyl-tRNA synthetase class 2
VDPIDQAERFRAGEAALAGGDEEAMTGDAEFVRAMEFGMPPISGWGMGVDRIVALLTEQNNLRDVVLFPLMKPRNFEE